MTDLKKEHGLAPKPEQSIPAERAFETPERTAQKIEKERPPETKHHEPEASTIQRLLRRPKQHVLPSVKDPVTQKIEKILEENVGEAYSRLSPIAKEEFKIKGEATAQKISELLKSTHVKVKKIFELIIEWLRMLPGINKFFLEQEAKIKTDRIIALHNRNKHL